MATITFIAGGGAKNYSDPTAWDLGRIPTAADDVIFATTTGTDNLTIDGTSASPSLARSVNCTSATKTITMGATAYWKIGDGTTGDVTFVTGMTFVPNPASIIEFASTATGNTYDSGGKTVNLVLSGVGGSWTQARNTTFTSFTHTAGTWATANFTFVVTSYLASNSNTRALNLGSSSGTLTNAANAIWDITISTGMTLTAGSSTITIANTTNNATFNGGGLSYGTITATALTSGTNTITGNNTIATATFSQGASQSGSYLFGGNQTVTGTLTGNGNSVINRAFYRSTVRGTARTLSAATFTFTQIDMQDITKAGAGSGNISAITGLSGDCGGNSGWTFTTQVSNYWVASGGTSTGSMSAVTRWASTSGGTAGTGRAPLPQDTAVFNASSIDAGSRTITQDMPRIGIVNWTGVTNTPAWTKSTTCSFFGSITMVSGMTNSGTVVYTYEGRSSSTIDGGGVTFTNPITIDAVDSVGTLTLGSTLVDSAGLIMTSGTLADASTYTMTFTTLSYTGGTLNNTNTATFTSITIPSGTLTQVGQYTMSAGLAITGGTLTQNAVITGGTTLQINTGGTYNPDRDTTFSGNGTMQSGTISGSKQITVAALTFSGAAVTFNATGTTFVCTTITLNGSGSTYNVKTITGSGAITATTGTMNHTGTITANTNAMIVPPAASGGMIQSRVFTGY